jgi:hypothetical protein
VVLTVADIDRWSAGAVREVFHTAAARGNATLEASRQLSTLSVFDSWEGATAEARKHTNASIRQDLDAHGNESLAVAQAAGKAADDIEKVQSELRTLRHDATELHMTINPTTNQVIPSSSFTGPLMEAEIAEMQLQPRLDKILAEANAVDAELAAAINMADGDGPIPQGPHENRPETHDPVSGPLVPGPLQAGQAPDPTDPFINDPRFGHWEGVPPPPPYTGGAPPPLQSQYRPFPDGTPQKVGPTTGMYVPGKTWIGDTDAPAIQGQEEYRFKLAGQQATTTTRTVYDNGHWQQQRWVQNVYQYQRNTSIAFGGDVGMKGIEGEQGDIGGLPPIQNIDQAWKPISLPQIAGLSGNNMGTTYYLPDGCGGSVTFAGGVPQGSSGLPPRPPVMTAPR